MATTQFYPCAKVATQYVNEWQVSNKIVLCTLKLDLHVISHDVKYSSFGFSNLVVFQLTWFFRAKNYS